jgi:hypothetical protein
MGPFTLRTDYPVFALGPVAAARWTAAVCQSDALAFVARPLSRIWIHGGMAFSHCRRLSPRHGRLVRQLPQLRLLLPCRPALPVQLLLRLLQCCSIDT